MLYQKGYNNKKGEKHRTKIEKTQPYCFPCLKSKVFILRASLKCFINKSVFNTTEEEWHQEQLDI